MPKCLGTTIQRLEPAKATGSQPQTTDQGEKAKLGNKGRILRPLNLEFDSLLPPIGAIRPAPPPRGKRATVTPGDGADERDTGATRQLAKRDTPSSLPLAPLHRLPHQGASGQL